MKMLNQRFVLIGVAAFAVAGIAWYVLSGSQSSVAAPPATVDTTAADQDVIATLLSLRATRLDNQIFSDPSFLTLSDFSTTIVPEPVGREYPFAPLGVDRPASTSVVPVAPAQSTTQPTRTTQEPASTQKPPASGTQSTPPAASQSQSTPPASTQSQTPASQQTPPADPQLCNQHKTYDACVACAQRRGYPPDQYQPYCSDLQPL